LQRYCGWKSLHGNKRVRLLSLMLWKNDRVIMYGDSTLVARRMFRGRYACSLLACPEAVSNIYMYCKLCNQ
jgi:hypothetical protein